MNSVWLMYHDVCESAPASDVPASASVYHVSRQRFAGHLDAIRCSGRRVISASEFARGAVDCDSVVVTFDDGWRGTFDIAMPMLQAMDWKATIFVTRDFLGRKHFADRAALRDAAAAGMEIGVHGTTHRMLSSCSREEQLWEFRACREHHESLLGTPVESASQPGGDWNRSIVEAARQAGLKSLGTSRPGCNSSRTDLFSLRRVAIKSGTSAAEVARYCRGNMHREVARWTLLEMPRRLLGMKNYSRLRRILVDEKTKPTAEVYKP